LTPEELIEHQKKLLALQAQTIQLILDSLNPQHKIQVMQMVAKKRKAHPELYIDLRGTDEDR
jgi:hypothetical protein